MYKRLWGRPIARVFWNDGPPEDDGKSPKPTKQNVSIGVATLIGRYGSAEHALEMLYGENYKLRGRVQKLRASLADTNKRVPSDKSVILNEAQAAQWAAYTALGTPEELTTRLNAAKDLEAQVSANVRETLLRKAAQAHGWNYDALAELARNLDVSTADVDGKPVYNVKQGDKTTPLADFAASQWGVFMPALQADGANGNGNNHANGNGAPFPRQKAQSGTTAPDKNAVRNYVTRTYSGGKK